MEISQKKNSNRTRFVFGDDELTYELADGSGSRSFTVPYAQITRDREQLVERNAWLRNVGLLWIALGGGLTLLSLAGESGLRISIWLWVGLGCYAAYQLRTTRYTIVPTERGKLFVIDDDSGERILQEIVTRRSSYLRREFDFLPVNEPLEVQRKRFHWLHREGALSDTELQDRLAAVDAQGAPDPKPIAHETRILN